MQNYVHIGMPKTGTTALQNWLYFNRHGLAKSGIHYPDMDRIQHFPLVAHLSELAGSPAVFPKIEYQFGENEMRLLVDKSEKRHDALVLSSEFFFDYPALVPIEGLNLRRDGLPYIQKVARLLADRLGRENTKIIIWVRRQDDWLLSMYNNVVKQHNMTNELNWFVQYSVGQHIGEIIDYWSRAFGDDNIILHEYKSGQSRSLDTIDQFCLDIGIERTSYPDPPLDRRRQNKNISTDVQELKRELNLEITRMRHSPARFRYKQFCERATFEFNDRLEREGRSWKYPMISPNERRTLLDKFASSNTELVKRFGLAEDSALVDWSDLNTLDHVQWPGTSFELRMEFFEFIRDHPENPQRNIPGWKKAGKFLTHKTYHALFRRRSK